MNDIDDDIETIPYRVTIAIDETAADFTDPNDYGLFEIKQWNRRLVRYADPDSVIACEYEPEDEAWEEEYGLQPCGQYQQNDIHMDSTTPFFHEYKPIEPFVTWLKYFEHGLCRWMRQSTYFPYDPGDWDTSKHAGVLILSEDGKTDWPNMTKEQRDLAIDGWLEAYTAWCNGSIYWVLLERRNEPTVCDCCNQRTNEDWETVDSLGGILDGDGDYLKSVIKEMLEGAGVENPREDIDYEIEERY